jgi:transposase
LIPPGIFLHAKILDFRELIDYLAAIVEAELAHDIYTGTLLIFCNQAKDKLKILYWDKLALLFGTNARGAKV